MTHVGDLLDTIDALEAELALEKAAALRMAIDSFPKSTVKDVIHSAYARAHQEGVLACKNACLALITPADQRALDAYVADKVALIERERAQWEKDYKSLLDASKHWPDEVADKVAAAVLAESEAWDEHMHADTWAVSQWREQRLGANRKAAGDSHEPSRL